jgi:ComF family protein
VYAVGFYEGSLRHAIHQFKFNGKIGLDRPLGNLLNQAIPADLAVDLVVPVPLQRKRLQQRSYNQALLLAREVAKSRQWPVNYKLLTKVGETESQQGLTAGERIKNLRGAFQLQGDLSGQKILLIDDVMTTGATVSACSQILIEGGVAEVYVAVIGRAA